MKNTATTAESLYGSALRLVRFWHRRIRNYGTSFRCNLCNSSLAKLRPLPSMYQKTADRFGSPYSFADFETINLQNYACPVCGATDRDRLYALYMRPLLESGERCNLLDIAPSSALSSWMRRHPNLQYRSADLQAPNVDDHIDITDMQPYTDGQFDFFVCSHVLEHVHDDAQAIKELHRVLRQGGRGIAMVPIHLSLTHTLYDPAKTSEAERWHHYLQGDHVRAYARADYVAALECAGFRVLQLGRKELGEQNFRRHAIGERSVLYVVEKP